MADKLKQKIVSGTKWTAIDNIASRLLQLAAVSVMARLLTPEDFGLVAIGLFFIAFGAAIEASGFTFAYIREHDADTDAFSALQVLSLGTALLVVLLLLGGAHVIAEFYDRPILEAVVAALSLTILIDGLSSPLRAHCEKSLEFRTTAKVRLAALVVSAVVAIASALMGAGFWALVLQQIVQRLTVLALLVLRGGYPRLRRPNIQKCREYLAYGWPLQLAGMLNILSREVNTVVVGKVVGVTAAGIYSRANNLQALLVQTTVSTVEKVAFPALSQVRDRQEDLLRWTRTSNRIYSFLIYPCLATMLVASDDVVAFLFGPQWGEAGYYMKFLVAIGWVRFLQSGNLTLLKVQGNTTSALTFRIYEALITVAMMMLAIPFGMIGLVLGQVASAYLSYVLVALRTQKSTGYTLTAQIEDVAFNAVLAIGCGTIAYFVQRGFEHELALLNILQTAGICFGLFFGIATLLRRPEASFALVLLRQNLGLAERRPIAPSQT